MALQHHHDVKITLNRKDYQHNRTLYGFETYIKEQDGDGRMVKRRIPDFPISFGPEQSADGFPFAWMSDLPANRKAIRPYVTGPKPEFSLDDEDLIAKWYTDLAPVVKEAVPVISGPARVVTSDLPMTAKDLDKLSKQELIEYADKQKVSTEGTKAQLIEAILAPKE